MDNIGSMPGGIPPAYKSAIEEVLENDNTKPIDDRDSPVHMVVKSIKEIDWDKVKGLGKYSKTFEKVVVGGLLPRSIGNLYTVTKYSVGRTTDIIGKVRKMYAGSKINENRRVTVEGFKDLSKSVEKAYGTHHVEKGVDKIAESSRTKTDEELEATDPNLARLNESITRATIKASILEKLGTDKLTDKVKSTNAILGNIDSNLTQQVNYTIQATKNYQQIATKLRLTNINILKDILKTALASHQTTKAQLEAIVLNTSLSNEHKQTLGGKAHDALITNLSDKVHDQAVKYKDIIKSKVVGRSKFLKDDIYNAIINARAPGVDTGSVAESRAARITDIVRAKMKEKTDRTLYDGGVLSGIGNAIRFMLKGVGEFAEKNTGKKSVKGGLAWLINKGGDVAGDLDSTAGSVGNSDPNARAYLTNKTLNSINVVIPGFLSKILQSSEMMRKGKYVSPLQYVYTSRTFQSSDEIVKSVKKAGHNLTDDLDLSGEINHVVKMISARGGLDKSLEPVLQGVVQEAIKRNYIDGNPFRVIQDMDDLINVVKKDEKLSKDDKEALTKSFKQTKMTLTQREISRIAGALTSADNSSGKVKDLINTLVSFYGVNALANAGIITVEGGVYSVKESFVKEMLENAFVPKDGKPLEDVDTKEFVGPELPHTQRFKLNAIEKMKAAWEKARELKDRVKSEAQRLRDDRKSLLKKAREKAKDLMDKMLKKVGIKLSLKELRDRAKDKAREKARRLLEKAKAKAKLKARKARVVAKIIVRKAKNKAKRIIEKAKAKVRGIGIIARARKRAKEILEKAKSKLNFLTKAKDFYTKTRDKIKAGIDALKKKKDAAKRGFRRIRVSYKRAKKSLKRLKESLKKITSVKDAYIIAKEKTGKMLKTAKDKLKQLVMGRNLLQKAKDKAKQVLDKAKAKAKDMLKSVEILKKAKEKAKRIIKKAKERAERMLNKVGLTNDRLGRFKNLLKRGADKLLGPIKGSKVYKKLKESKDKALKLKDDKIKSLKDSLSKAKALVKEKKDKVFAKFSDIDLDGIKDGSWRGILKRRAERKAAKKNAMGINLKGARKKKGKKPFDLLKYIPLVGGIFSLMGGALSLAGNVVGALGDLGMGLLSDLGIGAMITGLLKKFGNKIPFVSKIKGMFGKIFSKKGWKLPNMKGGWLSKGWDKFKGLFKSGDKVKKGINLKGVPKGKVAKAMQILKKSPKTKAGLAIALGAIATLWASSSKADELTDEELEAQGLKRIPTEKPKSAKANGKAEDPGDFFKEYDKFKATAPGTIIADLSTAKTVLDEDSIVSKIAPKLHAKASELKIVKKFLATTHPETQAMEKMIINAIKHPVAIKTLLEKISKLPKAKILNVLKDFLHGGAYFLKKKGMKASLKYAVPLLFKGVLKGIARFFPPMALLDMWEFGRAIGDWINVKLQSAGIYPGVWLYDYMEESGLLQYMPDVASINPDTMAADMKKKLMQNAPKAGSFAPQMLGLSYLAGWSQPLIDKMSGHFQGKIEEVKGDKYDFKKNGYVNLGSGSSASLDRSISKLGLSNANVSDDFVKKFLGKMKTSKTEWLAASDFSLNKESYKGVSAEHVNNVLGNKGRNVFSYKAHHTEEAELAGGDGVDMGKQVVGSDKSKPQPQRSYKKFTGSVVYLPERFTQKDIIRHDGRTKVRFTGANKTMLLLLAAMAAEYRKLTGKKLQVNSCWRTERDQQILRGTRGRYAAKGKSRHQYGYAIDLNTSALNFLDNKGLLAKYGFTRVLRYESWHIEPIGIQFNGNWARVRNNHAKGSQLILSGIGRGGGGPLPCKGCRWRSTKTLRWIWNQGKTPKVIIGDDLVGKEDTPTPGVTKVDKKPASVKAKPKQKMYLPVDPKSLNEDGEPIASKPAVTVKNPPVVAQKSDVQSEDGMIDIGKFTPSTPQAQVAKETPETKIHLEVKPDEDANKLRMQSLSKADTMVALLTNIEQHLGGIANPKAPPPVRKPHIDDRLPRDNFGVA